MEIAGVALEDLEYENIGSWPLFFRMIVIGGACLILLVLGYFFQFSDTLDELKKAHEKRIETQNTFASSQMQVANLEAYKEQVSKVQEDLNKLIQKLPKEQEAAGVLEDISNQATASGVQIALIRPGIELNKVFYIENPLELTLYGTFTSFGEFLGNVSNTQRIVTLHDFSIKKKDETDKETGLGPLRMIVKLKTYWITTPKEQGK